MSLKDSCFNELFQIFSLILSLFNRKTPNWLPLRSLFILNQMNEFMKEIVIESAAPPRRNKVIPIE